MTDANMGIRYSNPSNDLEQDQLRPKIIYCHAVDHFNCPDKRPECKCKIEDKNDYENKMCCKNACVFCIINLTKFDKSIENIEHLVNKFKIKELYIIYIVFSNSDSLFDRLNEGRYCHNAIILTAKQYILLFGVFDENDSILRIAELIENDITPKNPRTIIEPHEYSWPRNRMAHIIENRIKVLKSRRAWIE